MARVLLVALAILTLSVPAAIAGDATGVWMREDGAAKIRFAACGGGTLCGFIAWKKDPKAPGAIGEKVFFDLRSNGADSWGGTAYNPEDGRRYTGKVSVSGDHLVTSGCVLGGLICKSYGWTRAR